MKERKVYLQFETSYIDVSHLVKYDTLTITSRAFNDSYRYAQNECSFDVIYDDTVYQLYRYATKDILVKVEEVENGIVTPLFLGHATYTKKRTYNGILDNTFFSIDATDDLDYMDIPVGDIFVKGYSVLDPTNPSNSIVHYLANIAGWGVGKISSAVTISTVIECFAPTDPEDSVLDVLNDLLYEYGYVLNLDASGNIVPIKWNYTDVISTTKEFNDSNIMNEMRVSDSRDSYDSVQCTYYDIGFVDKVKLYHDSNCRYESAGSFTGYGVLSNEYYPPEANVIDDITGVLQVVEQEYTDDSIKYFTNKAIKENLDYNYKAFSSDFSAMIATEGHFADARTDVGITVTRTFGNKKCTILYFNPTGGMLNIWYNNVYGSVYYKSTERTVSVDLIPEFIKQYKYKSKYIYAQAVADSFAKGIASQYEVGKTKYEFDSETEYPAGVLVTVKTDDGTNQICLITERSWTEYSKTYTYKLLACGTDTGTIDLTKRTSSVKVNVQSVEPFNLELSAGQIIIPNLTSVPDFTNAFVYVGVKQGGKDYTGDWVLTATPTECSGYYLGNKYIITQTTKSVASVVLKATHPQWGILTKTVTINNMAGASEIIPEDIVISSAIAKQDYIDIIIDGTEPRYIYEISRNGGSTWAEYESTTKHFAHNFNRSIDGYPEKTALANYRIRAKAVNVYGNASLGYSPIASVDDQYYKTWIPPKPVIQALTAIESGFEFAVSYDDASFYGSGKRLEFYVEGVKKEERGGIILFNRSVDGYPETVASRAYHNITTGKALDNFAVRAKLITDENSGTLGDVKTPNVQFYKTWIPRLPSLALSVAGRKISLSIIPTNEVYGSIENRIQIRRYDEASYFALGNDDDAYTNETAYKQGAVNSYTPTFFNNYDQAVPLENQAAELPIDTSYYYRIQSRQSGFSDPVYTTAWTAAKLAIAKATSIRDITANSIKQAQLANKAVTNRTIDDLAVDTDQLAIGAVVADRIASRTITAEQLSVVARSKINSFIHESDGLTGWTTTGEIVTVGSERALKLSSPSPNFMSDPFDVQPDELLEFSFGLQCSREAEGGRGLYIGLTAGDTYEEFIYSWTDKKWNFIGVPLNAYFVHDYRSSTKKFFKTYILGYNIDITTVPSPQFTDESNDVRCLKLSSGKTQTRIRSGYNAIITPTFWYLFSPQVYQVGAGKIVAKQIDVKNLSAMSSKLGEIQGDTADYKLVMGSGGSAEEGTFLLGAETDPAYLRRWKKNGVWNMAIKLATFIVDAVSSKIKGVFEVQKTDGTPVFKMDPNSGKLTAPTLVGNVTGNLTGNVTGNADTATLATQALAIKPLGNAITLPATPTSVTKIIKIATVNYMYSGTININCSGYNISEEIKMYLNSAENPTSGIRVMYGKFNVAWGIKKIIVTRATEEWNSNRNIYAEIATRPNYDSITNLGVIEKNRGTFTPSMTEVSSVEGILVDSLSLDYRRGDISSYQHVFTKSPTAPTPATATNNTQVATTEFVKNQKYEPNRAIGASSIALGESSNASGDYSTALGVNSTANGYYSTALGESSTANGYYSTALGRLSNASGENSVAIGESSTASGIRSIALGRLSNASGVISTAIGYGAVATAPYQITIGTKFVYLRFASTETEATVYTALSPWVVPTEGYNQGSMGAFGVQEVARLHRNNSTTIELVNNQQGRIHLIRSGNPTQIGSNFAICTVRY